MTTTTTSALHTGLKGIVIRIIPQKSGDKFFVVRLNNGDDEAVIYAPDPEDEANTKWCERLCAGDLVCIQLHQVLVKRPGNFIGKLLPLSQQPPSLRSEIQARQTPKSQPHKAKPRAKQKERLPGTFVEARLSEEYHGCLKFAWKLARKQNPDLQLSEFTTGLVTGALQHYLPMYLNQLGSEG